VNSRRDFLIETAGALVMEAALEAAASNLPLRTKRQDHYAKIFAFSHYRGTGFAGSHHVLVLSPTGTRCRCSAAAKRETDLRRSGDTDGDVGGLYS